MTFVLSKNMSYLFMLHQVSRVIRMITGRWWSVSVGTGGRFVLEYGGA